MDDSLDINELKKILGEGTNLSENYHVFVDPRTKVRPAYSESANGWVDQENPTTVNLARMRPSTLAHEAGHVQQNLANLFDISQPQNENSEAGYRKQGRLGLSAVLDQLRARFPDKVGANVGDSSREILANLQGIEASLPAGQNIFNHLDIPPAYQRLLEQRMYPTMDKMFPSDFVAPQKPLQTNESVFQYIKRRLGK